MIRKTHSIFWQRSITLVSILLATLLINGCSAIVGATTDKPIEPHPGKRTFGTYIDDERLEVIAQVNIDKTDPNLKKANIHVDSFNGVILLTGQVIDESLRDLAATVVTKIDKVRQVHNEIQIQGNTALLSRTNDSWLVTKVKTKLLANKDVSGTRVKVIAENGTIYLMGLVSQVEAQTITELVSATGGVQKVVRVFEYID